LAPSSHNTQPWLFRIGEKDVELYADRTRSLPVVDPDDRELIISCGAALCHLKIALLHFGYFGDIKLLPDPKQPTLLARITLGFQAERATAESLLFQAIQKRRTNRLPFSDDPVPLALLSAVQVEAEREEAWLTVIREEESRYAIAELVGEGDRIQWADKQFRLELAHWVHSNTSPRRDGIPGYAQGVDDLLSYAGPLVVRTFDLGEGQAAKDREIAAHSPALVVLGTDSNSQQDWLIAGQALAKVLLRARAEGVWASFLNQPMEVPRLSSRLSELVGRPGFPQIVLRLGFGQEVKPTPRRPVHEVLIPA
jgi:hypothetical protein